MDSGERNIQVRLQGFLKKIKTEELRNKVAVWQKFFSNASTRLRFDSFSSSDEGGAGSSHVASQQTDITGEERSALDEDEDLASDDVCTPSDTETCILVTGKLGEMEEVIANGERRAEVKLLATPEEIVPRNKSPVQQWVDSLPSEETIGKVEETPPVIVEPTDAEVEGFTLGAEAVGVTSPRPYPSVQITNTWSGSDAGSHCSSMESLLESRKPDPEEVLLELGFGGCQQQDTVSRIPARFLQPSTLKGVVIEEFLKHQELLVHTYESGFSGYRGLSGPYYTIPSGIVGKIMERLRGADVARNNHHRHHITPPHKLNQKESVLSPDNRKWLERQGVSPEPEGRRIVLGKKTFTFSKDGGLIEGSFQKEDVLKENTDEKIKAHEDIVDNEQFINNNLVIIKPNKQEENESETEESHSFPQRIINNEQLELEFKTIALLANQLKGSDISIDIVTEEDFYKLTYDERKRIERGLVENALYTYQRRLRDLDLRTHLKEILASQADRVSNSLGKPHQEWINIARQMTTLLRHQETLRQELRFTKDGRNYGPS